MMLYSVCISAKTAIHHCVLLLFSATVDIRVIESVII
uniref:Uncharacterized protein n=1 Tax=Anguilla anguilla TaxID=7936 RepID=A0A0E9QD98_ANGAN